MRQLGVMHRYATGLRAACAGLGLLASAAVVHGQGPTETRRTETRTESGSASGSAEGGATESFGPGGSLDLTLGIDDEGNVFGAAPQIRIVTPNGAAGGAGGGGGTFFFSTGPMDDEPSSVLQSASVQKELEIVDDQREKLREIRSSTQKRIHDAMVGSIRKSADGAETRTPLTPKEMEEKLRAIKADAAKEVDNVLMPHQKKRLQQIIYRKALKNRGTSDALASGELSKELKVTDEQKERLAKRAAEVQKDLDKKIAKLREEAREEILDELDSNQKAKLKELLGAEFEDKGGPVQTRHIERREIRSSSESSPKRSS